jgi:hypothetical protein
MASTWTGKRPASRRTSQVRRLGFDVMEGRLLLSTATAPPASPATQATLGNQVSFAMRTYDDGKSIAASPAVRNVGLGFAKAALSADSRKVGMAYLKAAIHGNGKTLNKLGHTALVKKVGDQFTRLGHAKLVKYVGDALSRFGRSVGNEFERLFLHKSDKPVPQKTK